MTQTIIPNPAVRMQQLQAGGEVKPGNDRQKAMDSPQPLHKQQLLKTSRGPHPKEKAVPPSSAVT